MGDIATVLIDTGMRPEENSRLRWESISWSNGQCGTLQVTHGKTSGGTADASLEPARADTPGATLGGSKDALRVLGLGDGDGERLLPNGRETPFACESAIGCIKRLVAPDRQLHPSSPETAAAQVTRTRVPSSRINRLSLSQSMFGRQLLAPCSRECGFGKSDPEW
jgi:hypothetical protein